MSEHGFYHPDRGYWQTVEDVPDEILSAYPEGTVEIPLRPADGFHTWTGSGWSLAAPTIDELRAAKIAAITAATGEDLARGAPVDGGLHVALDDGSRADLTALASTAVAVLISGGSVTWPESYAQGWITVENTRVPLPTASDGLAFAAAVGGYYSAIIQHRRDLKDAALAAPSAAELDAIVV